MQKSLPNFGSPEGKRNRTFRTRKLLLTIVSEKAISWFFSPRHLFFFLLFHRSSFLLLFDSGNADTYLGSLSGTFSIGRQ
jgi:hypothetical protein